MKERLFFLLKVIIIYIVIFTLGRLVFFLVNHGSETLSLLDLVETIWYGWSLDLTVALYFSCLPVLAVMVSIVWKRWLWLGTILRIYFMIAAIPLVIAFMADIVLYHFWGIKFDASMMQFLDTTGAAFISLSSWWWILLIILFLGASGCIGYLMGKLVPKQILQLSCRNRIMTIITMLFLLPLMAIGIRGGIGESTSNVGQVYFSQRQFLNHAAVNPIFSFMASLSSTHQLPNYHFYDNDTCQNMLKGMFFTESDNNKCLLNTTRPNIVIIIMEGCGSTFTFLNGKSEVTPNLTHLAQEGVFFSNCYANSWRTDRGNVSILSGYPAFPNTSIMKIPYICNKLPSIARTLSEKGYYARYIYGGDINFTNTKGYLMSTGFNETISNKDFSLLDQNSSRWGVCDEKVLERTIRLMTENKHKGLKSMNIVMTLSSHEPWDVPMENVFDDKILNAFNYLDRSIGDFVEKLKANKLWDETLLIILPDHGTRYQEYGYHSSVTCHIPLIWTGGAVSKHKEIKAICNQSDLAATLLGQMNIRHDDFLFSRDVLSEKYKHPFASYSYTNHIALIDSTNQFHLYDLQDLRTPEDKYFRFAKALLQQACEDLQAK
ncbi:MAG: sulfatase-like hydrolase/transferase [Prevotella sp.]|nr:sulfatase-like hydrolase/transferase [Prevotella sp.]